MASKTAISAQPSASDKTPTAHCTFVIPAQAGIQSLQSFSFGISRKFFDTCRSGVNITPPCAIILTFV